MQKLVKCRIVFDSAQQRVAVDNALRRYGYIPVWIWRESNPTAYLLVSVNDDLYSSGDLNRDVYNTIIEACPEVEQLNCVLRDAEMLDVSFNGPSSITRTVNGNNTTVTQTTVINDGVGTWTYVFNTTFDSSGSVISTSNSSSYVDSHTQSNTTVTTDPVTGETTQSTTTTNSDGSSSEITYTYDENGNMQQYHDVNTNSDGSSVGHTTNYDENGNATDGNTQWVDTSQNQNTQYVEYDENGDTYVTQYTIDTSQNTSGSGEQISGGLDTGMIAFDGRDFDAVLKFAIKSAGMVTAVSTGGTGRVNPVISMTSRQTGKLNGTLVYFYNRNDLQGYKSVYNMAASNPSSSLVSNGVPLVMGSWKNGSLQSANKPFLPMGKTWTNSGYALGLASNSSTYYTFTLILHCIDNVISAELYDASGNTKIGEACDSTPGTHNLAYADFSDTSFDFITVEIGMYPYNTTPNYYYQEVIVHSFDIVKH